MLLLNSFFVPSGVCLLHSASGSNTNNKTGAFDIVSEFLPHISIILYRVYPTSHHFLRKIFRLSCITTLIGTLTETILTMYLFGSLWPRWTIAFKVTTPMLHVLFAAAQLWGSWNFWKMYQKQCQIIRAQEDGEDLESGAEQDERQATKLSVIVDISERKKLSEGSGMESSSSSRPTT